MRPYDRIVRVLLAWAAFVVGTAAAALVTAAVDPSGGPGVRVLRALAVLVVVLAVLAVLHRPGRRGGPDEGARAVLALARPRSAVLGLLVVGGAAAATLGVDHLLGGTTVTSVDVPALLVFLVTTTVVAAAQEAVPEELALRGSVLGDLRRLVPATAAVAVTTALFVLAPGAGITLGAVLGDLLGIATPDPALAPPGQDPAAYVVLLTCFGVLLAVARLATGSVWTGVGAHLTFLVVNRTFFAGGGYDTGVEVVSPPGAEVLVLVYLAVATAAFAVLGRRRRRAARATAPPGRSPARH